MAPVRPIFLVGFITLYGSAAAEQITLPCQKNLTDHRVLIGDQYLPPYARGGKWHWKVLQAHIKTKDEYGIWGYGSCRIELHDASSSRTPTAPDGHTCATVGSASDGFLSVRNGPTVQHAEIARLKPGDFVDVGACAPGTCSRSWRLIEYIDWPRDGDGEHPLRGWVNARYLHPTECLDEP